MDSCDCSNEGLINLSNINNSTLNNEADCSTFCTDQQDKVDEQTISEQKHCTPSKMDHVSNDINCKMNSALNLCDSLLKTTKKREFSHKMERPNEIKDCPLKLIKLNSCEVVSKNDSEITSPIKHDEIMNIEQDQENDHLVARKFENDYDSEISKDLNLSSENKLDTINENCNNLQLNKSRTVVKFCRNEITENKFYNQINVVDSNNAGSSKDINNSEKNRCSNDNDREESVTPSHNTLWENSDDESKSSHDENNPGFSDVFNSESDSGSSPSEELSSIPSIEEYDEYDVDLVSFDVGLHIPLYNYIGSSSDDQNTEVIEESPPAVLSRKLPIDKFSFPKAIINRQINSSDNRYRNFSHSIKKFYSSRRLVQRLKLYRSLKKHNGCVNTVNFNDTGNILVSASDDRHVCLWDWSRNKDVLYFDSGHEANVVQAKFLPYSNDTQLITCGQDYQIRMSLLKPSGFMESKLILKHDRPVHNIAMQRQMPFTFLSAGEDGYVYSIDVRDHKAHHTKLLQVVGHALNKVSTVCLYNIDCNPLKNYEFIVCGNDTLIRLYDQRKISNSNDQPLKTYCSSNVQETKDTGRLQRVFMKKVTCAVYNYNGTEILASYNNNDICLFDVATTKETHHYDGHRNFVTIKGINFYGPRSEYIVSGSDCSYIYIWDKESEAIVQWLKGDNNIVNCVESHPSFPVLATSGVNPDVKIWMPTSHSSGNIAELEEFQKITKKNNVHKRTQFLRRRCGFIVRPIYSRENLSSGDDSFGFATTLRELIHGRTRHSSVSSSSDDEHSQFSD